MTPKFSRFARRAFFTLHLWTGLGVGLWFALMGLSGSVLAWLPDLIPLEMRAKFPYDNPAPGAPPVPVSRVLAQVKAAHPELKAEQLGFIGTPSPRFPYYIIGMNHIAPTAFAMVDPTSGKVNPPIRVEDLWIGVVAHGHANLLLDAKGLIANGIGSALGLVMLLSGLWLWWPSNWPQLKTRLSFKSGASLKRRLLDWHNISGIYLFGVVFLVTLTGALLALNGSTGEGLEKAIDKRAGIAAEKPHTVKPTGTRLSDDELVRLAKIANPGMTLTGISRPLKPDAIFSAYFENPQPQLLGNTHLDLNPYTGKIVHFERDREASPGHKFIALNNDLHFGLFGGVWTKLLYTIAGLMPVGGFITGIWMWIRRLKSKKAQRSRRHSREPEALAV